MVKHNNALVKNHFRKDWEQHIKTWFQQPARKVKRRLRRKEKAAKLFPRPTEHLRPLIRCPTLRYNTKIRLGRGFSLDELKLAKIPPMQAKSIGIAIDWRRKNRSLETQRSNVQRLQLYKSKVVVFSKTYCPYCTQVKDLLSSLNANFEAIELDSISNGDQIQNSLKEFTAFGKKLTYKQQAQFFLNAYWLEHSKEAENVWNFTQIFIELDKQGEEGHSDRSGCSRRRSLRSR